MATFAPHHRLPAAGGGPSWREDRRDPKDGGMDDDELILDDEGRRVRSPRRRRRDDASDEVDVTCPWCFETMPLYVDPSSHGELVQDCDVCCHPWAITVSRSPEGALEVWIDRAQ